MKANTLRNCWKKLALAVLGVSLGIMNSMAASALSPAGLRCEYASNPTAIGVTQPRLSWVVETGKGQRGILQGAYQVLVASSPELLRRDQIGRASCRERV